MDSFEIGTFYSRLWALFWKNKFVLIQLVSTGILTVAVAVAPADQLPVSPKWLQTVFFGMFCASLTNAKKTIGQIIGRNLRYFSDQYGISSGKSRDAYHHALLDLIAFRNKIEKVTDGLERREVRDLIGFQTAKPVMVELDEMQSDVETMIRKQIQQKPNEFSVVPASSNCLRCILIVRNAYDHYLLDELDHLFRVKHLTIPPNVFRETIFLFGELSIESQSNGHYLRFDIVGELPNHHGHLSGRNMVHRFVEERKRAQEDGKIITKKEPLSIGIKEALKVTRVSPEGAVLLSEDLPNEDLFRAYIVHEVTHAGDNVGLSLWRGSQSSPRVFKKVL